MAAIQRERDMKVSDLRNRVALCSMRDVVEKDGMMALTRHEVVRCWAQVKASTNLAVMLSQRGYAIKDGFTQLSHNITIRAGIGVDITSAAWVYEERLKSQPRWYKVLGFVEDGNWLVLSCHLVEKSDAVTPPQNALTAVPSNVIM